MSLLLVLATLPGGAAHADRPGARAPAATCGTGCSSVTSAVENRSHASPPYAVTTRTIALRIGDRRVDIVVHRSAWPGPTFVNVHDDENTAVASALARLRCCGGRLIELRHGGGRDIRFALHGVRYTFDPNRIFTDRGARATLRRLGPVSHVAWLAVRRFAQRLISIIDVRSPGRVIAVHNNTPGHYSAASYDGGARDARDAVAVHIPPGADPDDFYFVTVPGVYARLRAQGHFAVVLQDNRHAVDDGSLSVYAAQHGIACFTVEAQAGHLSQQLAMYGRLLHDLGTSPAGAEPGPIAARASTPPTIAPAAVVDWLVTAGGP